MAAKIVAAMAVWAEKGCFVEDANELVLRR